MSLCPLLLTLFPCHQDLIDAFDLHCSHSPPSSWLSHPRCLDTQEQGLHYTLLFFSDSRKFEVLLLPSLCLCLSPEHGRCDPNERLKR